MLDAMCLKECVCVCGCDFLLRWCIYVSIRTCVSVISEHVCVFVDMAMFICYLCVSKQVFVCLLVCSIYSFSLKKFPPLLLIFLQSLSQQRTILDLNLRQIRRVDIAYSSSSSAHSSSSSSASPSPSSSSFTSSTKSQIFLHLRTELKTLPNDSHNNNNDNHTAENKKYSHISSSRNNDISKNYNNSSQGYNER